MAEQQGTWGDPTPVGLFAGGAGTTAVWALMTGRIGLQDMHIFIVWLAAVGVVQVITGLIHLKRGDPVGGSLNLAFGALFWCAPAMTLASLIWGGQPMAAMGIKEMPGLTINGWVFLILGVILCAFIPIMAPKLAVYDKPGYFRCGHIPACAAQLATLSAAECGSLACRRADCRMVNWVSWPGHGLPGYGYFPALWAG